MPKKQTSSSRITKRNDIKTKAGYYMYADGSSNWGCGLFRGKEKPLRIDLDDAKEMHVSSKEDKLKWYKAEKEEIAKAKEAAKK